MLFRLRIIPFFLASLIIPDQVQSQSYTQTVKGMVVDKAIQVPLEGAIITLLGSDPLVGTSTDAQGYFKLNKVPIGVHSIKINYLGYKEVIQSNINLNSGKETDLHIELEEDILIQKEVIISAAVEKNKPLNELSVVSARTFSVDETKRFAAAINDPARMATSFAGVAMPDDGNNVILIRGNAPNGLQWRMEGITIPNPNHFSSVGSSGGGISIISSQLLTNSDFMTGAFPAEYGNALSGVFDLKLRKGNNEKTEYTLQAGFLGLDGAVEGPITYGAQKGSFLFNYRYSTLTILNKLGLLPDDDVTNFQDVSFNIHLPAGRIGNFSVFGLGGLSRETFKGTRDSLSWKKDSGTRYNTDYQANTGVIGLTHNIILGKKTWLKSAIATSSIQNLEIEDYYKDDYTSRRLYHDDFIQNTWTLSSIVHHKLSARHFIKAGFNGDVLHYKLQQKIWQSREEALKEYINDEGSALSINAFAHWQYKINTALTTNIGLHGNFFLLNSTKAIEPRASIQLALSPKQSISMGYGAHSQAQPIGVYFIQKESHGVRTTPNKNLGLTQAHHLVFTFDQALPGNWHIKPEIYVQWLNHVPVSAGAKDSYSVLNQLSGFANHALVNAGKGKNYGLELTIERFLTKGFYVLWSSSLFESKYTGSDGIWRNTRFNLNQVNSLVSGKEWNISRKKNRTLGVNLKLTYMGGQRQAPIDLAASIRERTGVYDNSRLYEDQLPYYFRTDIGLRLKRNYAHRTTTLSLDIQNASNRKNVYNGYYNPAQEKVSYNYQLPLVPVLGYKWEF